jgi:hypothetical protein
MIEGVVDERVLSAATELLQPQHYDDVETERALDSCCGYVRCANRLPPGGRAPYQISVSQRKVYDVQNLRRFCRVECAHASRQFAAALSPTSIFLRRGAGAVEGILASLTLGSDEAKGQLAALNLAIVGSGSAPPQAPPNAAQPAAQPRAESLATDASRPSATMAGASAGPQHTQHTSDACPQKSEEAFPTDTTPVPAAVAAAALAAATAAADASIRPPHTSAPHTHTQEAVVSDTAARALTVSATAPFAAPRQPAVNSVPSPRASSVNIGQGWVGEGSSVLGPARAQNSPVGVVESKIEHGRAARNQNSLDGAVGSKIDVGQGRVIERSPAPLAPTVGGAARLPKSPASAVGPKIGRGGAAGPGIVACESPEIGYGGAAGRKMDSDWSPNIGYGGAEGPAHTAAGAVEGWVPRRG